MDPYDWLNKFYNCYVAILVSIINGRDIGIDMHHGNLPNKDYLVLYNTLIHCIIH